MSTCPTTEVASRIKRCSTMGRRSLRCLVLITTVIFALVSAFYFALSMGLCFQLPAPKELRGHVFTSPQPTEKVSVPNAVTFLELDDDEGIQPLQPSKGQRDRSGKYIVHLFVVTGSDWENLSRLPLCFATHASLDHLHHIVETTDKWTGPISLAVFTPDVEYQLTLIYVHYLRACFPELRRKVSFHFVYPVERPALVQPGWKAAAEAAVAVKAAGCSSAWGPREVLQVVLARRPPGMLTLWRNEMPYPQNLLRNLARSTCPGEHLVCPDVDMVVTAQAFAEEMTAFLNGRAQRECVRCAYVVPVYEVLEDQEPPVNKSQLLQLVGQNKARPFHIKVFRQNQGLSNLKLWEDIGQEKTLNVSYAIENFSFFYEPVYFASRDIPAFHESFVGFGYTRNTQTYEMFLAEWTFYVLNNNFLVHWGFQKLSSRPPWRLRQAAINTRRFPAFLREVAVRYDRDPLMMLKKFQRGKYRLLVQPKTQQRVFFG